MPDTSIPVPTIGRIVLYNLDASDSIAINERIRKEQGAAAAWQGNNHYSGDVRPAIIVRTWGDAPDSPVNLKVMIDGIGDHWRTSVTHGEGQGHFTWPQRS